MTPLHPISQPNYRPDIDGLRAIAILVVVAFHAFPTVVKGGFVGVDVFFVISGFLISRIVFRGIEEGRFKFSTFYAHRVKRIFPALIIVLVFCFVYGWFFLLPDEFAQLGKHMAAGAGFVQNIVLWREAGYFDVTSELKPLMHLWSLAIEEQFYLIYPLLIWIFWRIGFKLSILISLLFASSFALNIFNISLYPVEVFFLAPTRFWELLAGSGLAYLTAFKSDEIRKGLRHLIFFSKLSKYATNVGQQDRSVNNILAFAGLSSIAISVACVSKVSAFPGWWAVLPVLGAVLLIYAGPDAWVNRVFLASRAMVFVGLISYPLYLWHWPLLSFLMLAEQNPPIFMRLAAVFIAFIAAWLTYQFVEKPLRFGENGNMKVIILSVVLTAVALIGFVAYKQDGLTSRFPHDIRAVVAYKYEFKTDARAGECWLAEGDNPDVVSPNCLGRVMASDAINTVAVWGDSHAARLYPGLEEMVRGVAQFTRDSCPPVLEYGYPNCIQSNKATLIKLNELKPDTVVLHGVWNNYDQRWTKDRASAKGLLATIQHLQAAGIKNIVVVGPAPKWIGSLPKQAFRAWARTRENPQRMTHGLETTASVADADLNALLTDVPSVQYFSVLATLCNDEGCLVRASEDATSFTSWDYGHLTTAGARVVAGEMAAQGVLVGKRN